MEWLQTAATGNAIYNACVIPRLRTVEIAGIGRGVFTEVYEWQEGAELTAQLVTQMLARLLERT